MELGPLLYFSTVQDLVKPRDFGFSKRPISKLAHLHIHEYSLDLIFLFFLFFFQNNPRKSGNIAVLDLFVFYVQNIFGYLVSFPGNDFI